MSESSSLGSMGELKEERRGTCGADKSEARCWIPRSPKDNRTRRKEKARRREDGGSRYGAKCVEEEEGRKPRPRHCLHHNLEDWIIDHPSEFYCKSIQFSLQG